MRGDVRDVVVLENVCKRVRAYLRRCMQILIIFGSENAHIALIIATTLRASLFVRYGDCLRDARERQKSSDASALNELGEDTGQKHSE